MTRSPTEPGPPPGGTGSADARSGGPPATPVWVKVLGLVIALLVVAVLVVAVVRGGPHGPGRHGSSPPVTRPVSVLTAYAG
jgi:hypothetical protein